MTHEHVYWILLIDWLSTRLWYCPKQVGLASCQVRGRDKHDMLTNHRTRTAKARVAWIVQRCSKFRSLNELQVFFNMFKLCCTAPRLFVFRIVTSVTLAALACVWLWPSSLRSHGPSHCALRMLWRGLGRFENNLGPAHWAHFTCWKRSSLGFYNALPFNMIFLFGPNELFQISKTRTDRQNFGETRINQLGNASRKMWFFATRWSVVVSRAPSGCELWTSWQIFGRIFCGHQWFPLGQW